MSGRGLEIRAATEADIPAICAIYRREVLERAATFELTPPDEAEMLSRMRRIRAAGLPYLAALARNEKGGGAAVLAGYAYASLFRARAAYRFTAEDSIYVSPDFQRRGIGRALLLALLTECERLGFRQITAVISDPENGDSVRFHERAGFRRAGLLRGVGWKFGRWVNVEIMIRPLGPGVDAPPGKMEENSE